MKTKPAPKKPARTVRPSIAKRALPPTLERQPETILLAVTGMSPAILTETIWALAHPPADSADEAVIADRIMVLTTALGRREIETGLFGSQARFGGRSAWEGLRAALVAEGFDLKGRLRFGTTADDVRVFTAADCATGRTLEMDDIRSPADNESAATFILEQLRGLVEDPDKGIIASLAGGRKTMGALLYACLSLIGRDTDRLTHVLVSEPFDQLRDFYFPAQPGGLLKHRDGTVHDPATARLELADVPFVPLRHLFRRELGRSAGGFMRLVESCRAGVRERVGQTIRLTVARSRPEADVNGSRLKLAPREHLLLLFLANRAKNGEPPLAVQKGALDPLNAFREALRKEVPANAWSDWRLADSMKSKLADDHEIRRPLSSLRDKILALGGDAAVLAGCLPERGRFSLDVPAPLIFLKP